MVVRFLFCVPTAWYKKVGSEMIKLGEGVDAGHFAIELEEFGDSVVYEAVFPRSKKSSLNEWLNHYKVVNEYEFHVPLELQDFVKSWLDSMVGIRYSIAQIFIIGFTILFKPLDILLNTKVINQARAIICTEYGSRFIENFFKLEIKESHDKIGVKDMYDYSDELIKTGPIWK